MENLERLQWRVELLNVELQTDEERQRQFHLRRRIVEVLVDHVLITKDRDLRLVYRVDMSSILTYAQESDQIEQVGTCSRM